VSANEWPFLFRIDHNPLITRVTTTPAPRVERPFPGLFQRPFRLSSLSEMMNLQTCRTGAYVCNHVLGHCSWDTLCPRRVTNFTARSESRRRREELSSYPDVTWGTTWGAVRVCDATTLAPKHQRKMLRTFCLTRGYGARAKGVGVRATHTDSLKRSGYAPKVSDFPWPSWNA